MSEAADYDDRLREVEQQINTHEAVCAERYKGILDSASSMKKDVSNLNRLLVKVALTLLGAMGLILAKLVFH